MVISQLPSFAEAQPAVDKHGYQQIECPGSSNEGERVEEGRKGNVFLSSSKGKMRLHLCMAVAKPLWAGEEETMGKQPGSALFLWPGVGGLCQGQDQMDRRRHWP